MKRGYTRTELVFRDESKNINDEGRPILDDTDVYGPKKYVKAFQLLRDWIENSLQLYKVTLADDCLPAQSGLTSA